MSEININTRRFKMIKGNANVPVDDLFYQYRNDKFALLDSPNPDTITAFITPDTGCVRKMGHGDGGSEYACTKCLQIGRLTNMYNGAPTNLVIESGNMQHTTFGITEKDNVLYDVKWDQAAIDRFNVIDSIENLSSCGLNKSPRSNKYLASDSWLNESLVSWEIERILQEKEMPHINPIMIAYVCGNKGFTIDYDGIEPLTNKDGLNEDDAISILSQIGAFFLALKESMFIHGTFTIDKLGMSSKPCGYQYMGHNIVGPFTLYIKGFHLSSINIGDTRLVPSVNGRGVDLDYAVSQFKPVVSKCMLTNIGIGEPMKGMCENQNELLYKYSDNGPILFTTIRYSGYPAFGGSFDLYTIIVSLLSWEPFRCAVRRSERLTAIIRKLFPGNLPVITEENITCTYKVAVILSNTWLYCNALDKLFSNLKMYSKR